MSKRLQVLLDEREFDDLRQTAASQGIPVSEWVRRALREARRREPSGDLDRKLRAIEKAMSYNFPTADIGQMLEESTSEYRKPLPE